MLVTHLCPTLCDPVDCSPPGSSVHGILQARTLECSFLRGIFPTQASNLGLLHCRQILYRMSHKEVHCIGVSSINRDNAHAWFRRLKQSIVLFSHHLWGFRATFNLSFPLWQMSALLVWVCEMSPSDIQTSNHVLSNGKVLALKVLNLFWNETIEE